MTIIIGRILTAILFIAIITPILILVIVPSYNSYVKSKQRKLDAWPSNENLIPFMKALKHGPLTKYDQKSESFGETYKTIYRNAKIDSNLKKELYDLLLKKGCKEKDLK